VSGKPYPEGVSEAVKILTELDAQGRRISQLTQQISTASTELSTLRDGANANEKRLNELLSGMDLISRGNYGHEARRDWFLLEFFRQVSGPDRGGER